MNGLTRTYSQKQITHRFNFGKIKNQVQNTKNEKNKILKNIFRSPNGPNVFLHSDKNAVS